MTGNGEVIHIPAEYANGYDFEAAESGKDFAHKASYFGVGFIYGQFRNLRAALTQARLLLERERAKSSVLATRCREAEESALRLSRELAEAQARVERLKRENAELDRGIEMAASTTRHLIEKLRQREHA